MIACPLCWSDAEHLARLLGGSHVDRYQELLRAKHSEDTP